MVQFVKKCKENYFQNLSPQPLRATHSKVRLSVSVQKQMRIKWTLPLVFIYRSIKNSLIFATGLVACVVGTYISIVEIVNNFKHGH